MKLTIAFCVMLMMASTSFALGDRQGRRLFADATAIASSVANSNGGSSVVNSNANAQSTGSPTTAVSIGSGTAGPGQSVVVNCDVYAKDSVQYKACISPASVTFETAPACNLTSPNATCAVKDSQGRCWNYENGRSCAYKDAAGKPLNQTQIAAAAPRSPAVGTASPAPSPPAPKASPAPLPLLPARPLDAALSAVQSDSAVCFVLPRM